MISPRGYAIQFALPISLPSPLSLPAPGWFQGDLHKQGLIRLAKLFAVFDAAPVLKLPQNKSRTVSVDLLLMVEKALEEAPPCPAHHDVVQKVDYLVTQHWMRLLLWQQAMSRGLLSSVSLFNSMRVTFPTYLARDILGSVAGIPADAFACGGEALVVSPTSDSSHSKLTRIDGSRLSSSKLQTHWQMSYSAAQKRQMHGQMGLVLTISYTLSTRPSRRAWRSVRYTSPCFGKRLAKCF